MLDHARGDLALAELYPVHRLDVATSGLVLLAKTPAANRQLSMAFEARRVIKHYVALTAKKPLKKQGWVIGDMEKSRGGNYRLSRSHRNPARTALRSFALEDGRRLWVLRPLTGKTHQLRVALKSLAAPIIGDARYGGEPADRMYLHAWRLEFTLDGCTYRYVAEPQKGELFGAHVFKQKLAELQQTGQWQWDI